MQIIGEASTKVIVGTEQESINDKKALKQLCKDIYGDLTTVEESQTEFRIRCDLLELKFKILEAQSIAREYERGQIRSMIEMGDFSSI